MAKMKTNRSAAKRFKRTGTGKYKKYKSNKTHILTKKSPKRKRQLRKPNYVSKSYEDHIKKMLPYG